MSNVSWLGSFVIYVEVSLNGGSGETHQLEPVESCNAVILTAAVISQVRTDGRGIEIGRIRNIWEGGFAVDLPRRRGCFAGQIFAFRVEPRIVKSGDQQFPRCHRGRQQMLVERQQFRRILRVFIIRLAIPVTESADFPTIDVVDKICYIIDSNVLFTA